MRYIKLFVVILGALGVSYSSGRIFLEEEEKNKEGNSNVQSPIQIRETTICDWNEVRNMGGEGAYYYVNEDEAGTQFGVYIKGEENVGEIIKGFSMRFDRGGLCTGRIQFRLMDVDEHTSAPGGDLFKKEYLYDLQELQGEVFIDVSKEGIQFPARGVFVVIAIQELAQCKEREKGDYFGIGIVTGLKKKEEVFWVQKGTQGWQKFHCIHKPCISLDVRVETEKASRKDKK